MILTTALLGLSQDDVQDNRDVATIVTIGSHVTEADPGTVDPSLDGKIVHVSGVLKADAPIVDPDTGISVRGLSLHRDVAMFQWAHEETFYTNHHRTLWSPTRIPQGPTLTNPKAPSNPLMPFEAATFDADNPYLGAYGLDTPLIAAALRFRPTSIGDPGQNTGGNMLNLSNDPNDPAIGDMKVWYSDSPYQVISVIGIQSGGKLMPIHSMRTGEDLVLLQHNNGNASSVISGTLRTIATRRWHNRSYVFLAVTLGMFCAMMAFGHEAYRLTMAVAPLWSVLAMTAVLEANALVPEPSRGLIVLCGAAATVACVYLTKKLANLHHPLRPRWA